MSSYNKWKKSDLIEEINRLKSVIDDLEEAYGSIWKQCN